MDKQENNELIARFMGWSPDERYQKSGGFDVWTSKTGKNAIIACNLNYDKDWNSLMLVIEKIIKDGWIVTLNPITKEAEIFDQLQTKFYTLESDEKFIDSVYKAIVKFIEHYNNKKQ